MKLKIWKTVVMMLNNSNSLRFYQINVADICKELGIHRSTFYRYFNSKYELLEYGIELLWNDYISNVTMSALLNPFQYSAAFFESSNARNLIKSQNYDDELLGDIKRITLESLRILYKDNILENKDFYSSFIIANIDFIDDWNQHQRTIQSPKELDELFQNVVLLDKITFK